MNLIELLKNAPEGSREMDALIWCAINGVEFLYSDGMARVRGNVFLYRNEEGQQKSFHDHLLYTTSLDAALTLVPENVLSWKISDTPGGPHAWLYDGEREYDGYPNPGCGTPALALCIAALKAKGGRE